MGEGGKVGDGVWEGSCPEFFLILRKNNTFLCKQFSPGYNIHLSSNQSVAECSKNTAQFQSCSFCTYCNKI